MAGDQNVYLLVQMMPEEGKRPWMRVVVYGVSNGTIAGATVFEDDPAAAAACFSGEAACFSGETEGTA